MTEAQEVLFRQLSGSTVVEWEIKDFANIRLGIGQEMLSPTFWVSNASWQLQFYPEGESAAEKDYVSLYLCKVSGKDPFYVEFTLSIVVNNQVIQKLHFEESFADDQNYGWGEPCFIERSKIFEHLVPVNSNDTVILVCSMQDPDIIQKDISTQTSSSFNSGEVLSKNFEEIFLSQKHSDVKLKVGTKHYSAHKTVLAARSPVFSSMFENQMSEDGDDVIEITNCDVDVFELFLKFLYTGNVEETTNANRLGLCMMADKYRIEDLKKICCKFVSGNLEINSICEVLDMAITQGEAEVFETAVDFFTMNATDIFMTEKWQSFLREKSSVASEILKQMSARAHISLKPRTYVVD